MIDPDDAESSATYRRRDVLALLGVGTTTVGGLGAPSTGVYPSGDSRREETAPWPTFGHDARNTGYAPGVRGPALEGEVEWTYEATGGRTTGAPVVANDTAFAITNGDFSQVLAVDAETGEKRWSNPVRGPFVGAPTFADGTLYVPTFLGRRVRAFDASDGAEVWTTDIGHYVNESSPTVVDGTLYVGTIGVGPLISDGSADEEFEACAVVALDAASGKEQWRFDALFDERTQIDSTPAVDAGAVFVTADDGYLYALDADAGSLLWRTPVGTRRQSPVVQDGTVYVARDEVDGRLTSTRLLALDAETGEVSWQTGVEARRVSASPAVADGTVYLAARASTDCAVATNDPTCTEGDVGVLYAIDADAGTWEWGTSLGSSWYEVTSDPAVTDSHVFLGAGNGLVAVGTDGETAWQVSFDDRVQRGVAIGTERVYVGHGGSVYAVR